MLMLKQKPYVPSKHILTANTELLLRNTILFHEIAFDALNVSARMVVTQINSFYIMYITEQRDITFFLLFL